MLALMAAVWSGCVSTSGGSAVSEEEVQQLAGTWYVMGQAMILNENGTGSYFGHAGEWSVSNGKLTFIRSGGLLLGQTISGRYQLSDDGAMLHWNSLQFTRNP